MAHDPICVGLAEDIMDFLNQKCRTAFKFRTVHGKLTHGAELILARLADGATPDQCRQIIVRKHREWSGRPDMRPYLRPETLFGRRKFESYVGELGSDR